MNVTCRCGQAFSISAKRFPHTVSCHACGRHFNVMDDGTIIESEKPADSAAIQAELLSQAHFNEHSTNITENPPDDHIRTALAHLRLIDQDWQTERAEMCRIPLLGITIVQSKMLS